MFIKNKKKSLNEGDDGREERDFKEKEEEESVGGKLGNLSEEG